MGKNRMLVLIMCIALGLAPLTAGAAEELFDSKAATEHIEKGIMKLKAGNYDAAIGEFEEAASISPDAEAYYYLGYTYYMKARRGTQDGESRKKSLDYFKNAYEIDPNFTPTRYKVAPPEQQPGITSSPSTTGEAVPSASPAEPAAPAPAPSAQQPGQ